MKTRLVLLALACVCVTAVAQTNTAPVAPDRIGDGLEWLRSALEGALTLVAVLLGWWGTNKSKIAAVVAPIIKAVHSHGSQALKDEIEKRSGKAGTEPTLNALVKANKASAPDTKPAEPPKP